MLTQRLKPVGTAVQQSKKTLLVKVYQVLENSSSAGLGQDISPIFLRTHLLDLNLARRDCISDKEIAELNMLGAGVIDRI